MGPGGRFGVETDAGPGHAVWGRGYDDSLIQDDRHLSRADLDAIAPEQAVAVRHISGHLTYVNTRLLEDAGVTRETPDPAGGKIERDESGAASGVLYENAGRVAEGVAESGPSRTCSRGSRPRAHQGRQDGMRDRAG